MNAESSRLRSTGTTSNGIGAIWPGALLVVYLTATGILLLIGRSRVSAAGILAHFALLSAIAAATWMKGSPRWLQLWAPLIAVLFLYSELPMIIRAAGHDRLFDTTVIAWERALFGGQPAIDWAARWRSLAVSEPLHAAYLSYYAIIASVPAALYFTKRNAEFVEATFVLMLTFVACFTFYVIFPVAGPRYFWLSHADATGGPLRSATVWLLQARSSMGTAFPSSHVAVAVTQSILATLYFGRNGLAVLLPTAGLAIGAIYGGFHYAVDVLAGALAGAVLTVVGRVAVHRLRRGPQANATAPT
jgi:membrane-associated phospholipid phosphatase